MIGSISRAHGCRRSAERTGRIVRTRLWPARWRGVGVERVSVMGAESRHSEACAVRRPSGRSPPSAVSTRDIPTPRRSSSSRPRRKCRVSCQRKPLPGRAKSNVRPSPPDEHDGDERRSGDVHEAPSPRPSARPLCSDQRAGTEPDLNHGPQRRRVHVIGVRIAVEGRVVTLPMKDRPQFLVVGIEQGVEPIAEFEQHITPIRAVVFERLLERT